MYKVFAEEVKIGKGVIIEDDVVIGGKLSKSARSIVIGDNSYIGRSTRIAVEELQIGDYTILHNHALITGEKPCKIGHCCWFGQNTILNSAGGLTIGNGVGVGAYSQLWSHIAHGDTLQGCRWNAVKPLIIDDDVWFVGHCIVSPIHAHEKSIALVGSVVTKDMEPNHVYAGVPAKDMTDKLGPQFEEVSVDEKYDRLCALLNEFYELHPEFKRGNIKIVRSPVEADVSKEYTVFDVSTRSYTKRLAKEEVAFMKYMLPLIKFFPR